MARKITGSMNLVELMTQFPDEEKCRATLGRTALAGWGPLSTV